MSVVRGSIEQGAFAGLVCRRGTVEFVDQAGKFALIGAHGTFNLILNARVDFRSVTAPEFLRIERVAGIAGGELVEQDAALGGIFFAKSGDGEEEFCERRKQDSVIGGFLKLFDAYGFVGIHAAHLEYPAGLARA